MTPKKQLENHLAKYTNKEDSKINQGYLELLEKVLAYIEELEQKADVAMELLQKQVKLNSYCGLSPNHRFTINFIQLPMVAIDTIIELSKNEDDITRKDDIVTTVSAYERRIKSKIDNIKFYKDLPDNLRAMYKSALKDSDNWDESYDHCDTLSLEILEGVYRERYLKLIKESL